MFANTFVYVFVYVPIKLTAVRGNPKRFYNWRNLTEKQMHINRHLFCPTVEINQFSVLLKLGNTRVTLPTSVTTPMMDNYRDRSII